ncbi:hypothetical protein SAMN05518865_111226 [Duganella sp. CF458]|uniref:hypothetical protein n=1 Tax=Duganella sp. CF458 TaxID=1884368 RepID=UPI0008DEF83B|nr:hypothetical protein [Duganella sp. CF458]SFG39953.1 hypothetical protein SAMN05518865_111226 [Duganella sp. CF458]
MRIFSSLILAAAFSQAAVAAPDVVPLELVSGIPFVDITVGAASSRVMFNSRARLGVSLPATVIAAAGSVKVTDERKKFQDFQGQAYEVPIIVAERLIVGSTLLAPVRGQVHARSAGAAEGSDLELARAREGGAIGLEAFTNFPLMFDYKRRTMSILEPEAAAQLGLPEWRTLDLQYGSEGPLVTLTAEGKHLKFLLDTGSQLNLLKHGVACNTSLACELRDLSGRLNFDMKIHRIKLDGAAFDGILGAPFFRSHRVVFDVKGRKLHLAPNLP